MQNRKKFKKCAPHYLMCCDISKCQHSYCLGCLETWLGKKTLDDFLADDKMVFCCFVCTF